MATRMARLATTMLLTGCAGLTAIDKGVEDETLACAEADQLQAWDDADGDGFGSTDAGLVCALGVDQAGIDGDCDDLDPLVFPDATEACDDVDNDCDAQIDEDLADSTFYADDDGDGFGDPDDSRDDCVAPEGYTTDATDCDDAADAIHPGAEELCNDGIDDDCDGLLDDADDMDPALITSWYRDLDGDGYGNDVQPAQVQCESPGAGSVDLNGDCDDANPNRSPGEAEVCNGVDDNCDGLIDEADPAIDPALLTDFYADLDSDGYGDPAALSQRCFPAGGLVTNDDDCDDTDPTFTVAEDWLADGDGDGIGAGASLGFGCAAPVLGSVRETAGTDCDDGNAGRYPGNTEICGDGVDQDCDLLDPSCGPIGSYLVNSGPVWTGDPPVYNCLEACAIVFGGVAGDYHCSTSGVFLDNLAFVSGYADAAYCTTGRPETFKLEQVGNPGYNCGAFGCSYSAYVQDNCATSRNWCWPN